MNLLVARELPALATLLGALLLGVGGRGKVGGFALQGLGVPRRLLLLVFPLRNLQYLHEAVGLAWSDGRDRQCGLINYKFKI